MATTPAPQTIDQSRAARVLTRFQPGLRLSALRAGDAALALARSAPKISVRSTIAAPMIVPSAIRNMILRGGSPASSQPIETKYGFSAQPSSRRPPPARPMRAPTTMPAPNVEVDSSIAPSSGDLRRGDAADQPGRDAAAEHARTERRSSTGSVSARRMLATARPDGKGQLHPVDEDRRVEHADADAEHADRQHVERRAARSAAAAARARPSPGSARPSRSCRPPMPPRSACSWRRACPPRRSRR